MNPSDYLKRNKAADPLNIGKWLARARTQINVWREDEPSSTLFAIGAHALGRPVYWAQVHPEYLLTPDQINLLDTSLARLLAGEPLAYILGEQAFFGTNFFVDKHVLIPRPETEMLVEHALEFLGDRKAASLIADVGTGSGCVALSIAANCPNAHVIASDLSLAALRIAQINCLHHGLEDQVSFVQADLLAGLANCYDLICANLPYIPSAELIHLAVIQNEPRLALDGGTQGLDLITGLLFQAKGHVRRGGILLLEISAGQSAALYSFMRSHFPAARIRIIPDMNEHPRLVKIDSFE